MTWTVVWVQLRCKLQYDDLRLQIVPDIAGSAAGMRVIIIDAQDDIEINEGFRNLVHRSLSAELQWCVEISPAIFRIANWS